MIREIKHLLTMLDNDMFMWLQPLVSDTNTRLMLAASFFASHFFLLPANIFLAAWAFFLRKSSAMGWTIVVVALGSVGLVHLLKFYFHRIRPVHPVHQMALGFSFPSGHAMSAITFYGLIIYLFVSKVTGSQRRWLGYCLCALMILMIGLSRIYLRVHYFSDVLGGYAFGYLWLVISLWVMNKFTKISYGTNP